MKKIRFALLLSCFALPLAASAQTVATTGTIDLTRRTGDREFVLGGAGAASTDLDDSLGGANFSFGHYFNETLMLSLRQTANYSNPDVGGTQWNGSTRLALDQHLSPMGVFRPFVGVNFGRVYGDAVSDTWAAGLEIGGKYYVLPRTFIFGMVDYGWFFEDTQDVEDTFEDGQFTWVVGIGFNF